MNEPTINEWLTAHGYQRDSQRNEITKHGHVVYVGAAVSLANWIYGGALYRVHCHTFRIARALLGINPNSDLTTRMDNPLATFRAFPQYRTAEALELRQRVAVELHGRNWHVRCESEDFDTGQCVLDAGHTSGCVDDCGEPIGE